MKSKRPRNGFTLLELALVLMVLVFVAAMILPAMDAPLANQRLREAAEQVRTAFSAARVRAMKTGAIHVFHFQPDSGVYRVEKWSGLGVDETNLSAGLSEEDATASPFQAADPQELQASQGKSLPEGVTFHLSETKTDTRDQLLQSDPAAAAAAPPIFFYPDGTTSTAAVLIGNQREQHIRLRLRGFTGITTVSDLLDAEELP